MIAILTDFGNSEYLGVMKGVIQTIAPNIMMVDLCNTITHQNIIEGAWILYNNYRFFPKDTIFLCVVDPGVGTGRKPIIIETENYYFVGPDNGLMQSAAEQDGIVRICRLEYLDKISSTFHGRDIFAPASAKLAKNINLDEMGEYIHRIQKLDLKPKKRIGMIMRIDSFGNIITNLKPMKKKEYTVRYKGRNRKMRFFDTYDEGYSGKPFLIKGSSDTLEISIKEDSAQNKLKAILGMKIEIK